MNTQPARNSPTFALLSAAVATLALLLASCGTRGLGYGVVLWSNDDAAVKTGAVVRITSQSKYTQSYLVAAPDSRKEVTMAMWRLRMFRSDKQAAAFAEQYKPYVAAFAQAIGTGVPIRETPDQNAQRTYRMRDGQKIKVIGRSAAQATVNGASDYWYQVLTEDGATGYCFGKTILLLGAAGGPAVGGDPLQIVFGETFRPTYFQDMITSGHIDLNRFDPRFGLFVDQAKKSLTIVTPTSTSTFTYTGVRDQGGGDYAFEGTPVLLSIISPTKIRLRYPDTTGKMLDEQLVAMSSSDVEKAVKSELDRRTAIYQRFLGAGAFTSDYYGQITFAADFAFTWRGYTRLVPDVIPSGAGTSGAIDFGLTLDDSIKADYDGALTFRFNGSGGAQSVSFLYSFARGGLRLTYVPPSSVTDSVVTGPASTPLVIFFTAAR